MKEGSGEKGASTPFHQEELTLCVRGIGGANVFDVKNPVFEWIRVDIVISIILCKVVSQFFRKTLFQLFDLFITQFNSRRSQFLSLQTEPFGSLFATSYNLFVFVNLGLVFSRGTKGSGGQCGDMSAGGEWGGVFFGLFPGVRVSHGGLPVVGYEAEWVFNPAVEMAAVVKDLK